MPDAQHRRRLATDTRAAAAIEFAMLAVPFFGVVLGILTVGFSLFMQEALDQSLHTAVRQVQLGLVPATYSAADFAEKVFCPVFGRYGDCGKVAVTLLPVANFGDPVVVPPPPDRLGLPGGFCVGAPGQLMFARAVFAAPVISQFWPYAMQGTVNGTTGNVLVSTAAFANENPSGAAVPAAGAC